MLWRCCGDVENRREQRKEAERRRGGEAERQRGGEAGEAENLANSRLHEFMKKGPD